MIRLGLLFLLLSVTACQPLPPTPPPLPTAVPLQILRIGVATTVSPLADLIAEPYAQVADNVAVQFVPGNTAVLLADLGAGNLDAVLSPYVPEGEERWFNPVVLDGLVLVVHPDNPVTGLSLAEVQAVFNGRITHWSALGGADQPITLISREEGSGVGAIFQNRVMAEQRININARVQAGDEALRTAVAADPAAIGFSLMGAADAVKVLAVDGRIAAPETVQDQSYPLTTPIYFINQTPAEPDGALRGFLAWLQAATGQAVVGVKYGRVR